MRKIEREPNGAGIFRPGQDLVVAGTVGKNGVKAALSAKEKEISARFPEWFVKRIREQADKKSELTPEMLNACGAGEWEEISEGGILAALWIISGAYEQGISFELRKIPVAQETIEICELFDLNPYRLSSGECLLMAVENGGDAVKLLSEAGIPSAVIGKVEKGIASKVRAASVPSSFGFILLTADFHTSQFISISIRANTIKTGEGVVRRNFFIHASGGAA